MRGFVSLQLIFNEIVIEAGAHLKIHSGAKHPDSGIESGFIRQICLQAVTDHMRNCSLTSLHTCACVPVYVYLAHMFA